MDEEQQQMWVTALRIAWRYVGRWVDPSTRRARDDIAQEATVAFWRYAQVHPTRCVRAVVQSISRRTRIRALRSAARAGLLVAEGEPLTAGGTGSDPGSDDPGGARNTGSDEPCLRVDGALVSCERLLPMLREQLRRLGPTNRRIVLAYYEGFSCAELGERLGLSEDSVKVRLHRSRGILRRRIERMTRAAGHFER